MAGPGLLLGRGDDPDIVAELASYRFEKVEAARVHAVIVGKQDPHAQSLWGSRLNAATAKSIGTKCAIFAGGVATPCGSC